MTYLPRRLRVSLRQYTDSSGSVNHRFGNGGSVSGKGRRRRGYDVLLKVVGEGGRCLPSQYSGVSGDEKLIGMNSPLRLLGLYEVSHYSNKTEEVRPPFGLLRKGSTSGVRSGYKSQLLGSITP